MPAGMVDRTGAFMVVPRGRRAMIRAACAARQRLPAGPPAGARRDGPGCAAGPATTATDGGIGLKCRRGITAASMTGGQAMITLRRAAVADAAALGVMHRRAVLGLAGSAYDPAQVVVLGHHLPDCGRLIADGTLLVALAQGRILGSAGWSMAQPEHASLLDAAPEPLPGRVATVRAVFVDPAAARTGLGTRLMLAVEEELAAERFAAAELMAMLSGVPLYRRLGYAELSRHVLHLPGQDIGLLRMAKALPCRQRAA
jgi:GNAT superfamily N-acetyltransferase